MSDQASPGPVAGVGQEGGALAPAGPDTYQPPEVYHGRTVSWVVVSIIMAGFLITIAGIATLLAMVIGNPSVWAFAPGLLLIGLGLGLMLTPSVNVVQSAFPEERQGEISGL